MKDVSMGAGDRVTVACEDVHLAGKTEPMNGGMKNKGFRKRETDFFLVFLEQLMP